MENIISLLENISLNDNFTFKYLKPNSFNTQKCYCSTNNFKKFKVHPGHPVFLKNDSQFFLCILYPKPFLTDDILEIDKSVSIMNDTYLSDLKKFSISIQKGLSVCKIKTIEVEIIFETLQDLSFWHSKEKHISLHLKNYVFKYFMISNECHVNLKNFSKIQRFGIHKLLVKASGYNNDQNTGKVDEKTKIQITNLTYKKKYDLENSFLPSLYGMEIYIDRLTEIIDANKRAIKIGNIQLQPSKQILLVGPTGCGKSSLVTLIAQMTKSSIISIVDHDITQKEPGETESSIRNIFNDAFTCAKLTGSCILNLDEISNLCPKRQHSSSHVQRAATQILLLLDEAQNAPGIIVIATTNKPENLDPSVRRYGRLETEIFVAPPTEFQRQIINESLLLDLKLNLSDANTKILSQSIATMTPGYVGADLKQIFQKIHVNGDKTTNSQDDTLIFWTNEFRKIISSMKPASLKGTLGTVTVGQLSFDNLAGLDDIKKSLQMSVLWPLQHAESFKRMGIGVPKGVLLYGPPGCAKTSLVKALISLGTFSLLSISAAELYSPFVGDAERLIVKLFERARQNSPCIIFIDEIDSLTGSRSTTNDSNSDVQERILASLLTQMDGIGHHNKVADFNKIIDSNVDGVVVIGATNRPDKIDPALLRPGRFDKHIYVPPPNEESRLSILKLITKKMPIAQDVDLSYIAAKTKYFSGADIKNICAESALLALFEDGMEVEAIKNSHFLKALSNSRPSLNENQISEYTRNFF